MGKALVTLVDWAVDKQVESGVMFPMRQWLLAMLGGIALLLSQLVWAQELRLAANEKATEQLVAEILLKEIYKSAGLVAQVEPLPGARANAALLRGEKDGEVARIRAYSERNPSLIRVDPPYYYLTTAVFARQGQKPIKDKAELASYRVGTVRGIAHAEAAVAGLSKVEVVSDYEQLFRMLDAGRIDVAIDTGINGRMMIKRLALSRVEQVGELARLDLHTMLHPKHEALAARIGNAIRSMKASGELDKLIERTEHAVISASNH